MSYQADGDVVHDCACIANWGRDGPARGLWVVGGGFILLNHNDIDRTQWAGVYLAQENSYMTYGVFDVTVRSNTNHPREPGGQPRRTPRLRGRPRREPHDGVARQRVDQIRRITVTDNAFGDTSAGVGNGFGIEIRSSVDTGAVTDNVLTSDQAQLVVKGTNSPMSGNQIQ